MYQNDLVLSHIAAAAAAAGSLSAKTVSMATDGQKIGGGAKEEMENWGKTKGNIFARRNTYMSWAQEKKEGLFSFFLFLLPPSSRL